MRLREQMDVDQMSENCVCVDIYICIHILYIYRERVFSVSKIKEQSLSLKAWFVPRHGLVFYRVVRFV